MGSSENDEEVSQQPKLMKSVKKPKPGVVYLSSVPHLMNPGAIKIYFENVGFPVGRMYFRKETKKQKAERVKHGGNGKCTKYMEGWIEFVRKSDAKSCAASFTGTRVGGNARYADSLWSIRYLRGFKFDDLTEEAVYKKQLHDKKVREEIAAAKEATQSYLDRVARAKRIETAIKKKKERGEAVTEPVEKTVRQKRLRNEVEEEEDQELAAAIASKK